MEKMHGYIAIFRGRRIELRAPSLLAAKQEAVRQLKLTKRQVHLLCVALAELADGTPVVHKAVD